MKTCETLLCPYCNSDNIIKKRQTGYIILVSIFLLGFPLPFMKKSYYCYDCGKEWKIQ